MEGEMRRRDTRCKQWKRVHDVPLSPLIVSRLCLSFIISLFIFRSAFLFPFLLFSLSLVNIYMCIRLYILVFLSIFLFPFLTLCPFLRCFSLSLRASFCLCLSFYRTRQRNTAEVAAAAAAAAATAARYVSEREREKERERDGKRAREL